MFFQQLVEWISPNYTADFYFTVGPTRFSILGTDRWLFDAAAMVAIPQQSSAFYDGMEIPLAQSFLL
jgi:hypothetical protein